MGVGAAWKGSQPWKVPSLGRQLSGPALGRAFHSYPHLLAGLIDNSSCPSGSKLVALGVAAPSMACRPLGLQPVTWLYLISPEITKNSSSHRKE